MTTTLTAIAARIRKCPKERDTNGNASKALSWEEGTSQRKRVTAGKMPTSWSICFEMNPPSGWPEKPARCFHLEWREREAYLPARGTQWEQKTQKTRQFWGHRDPEQNRRRSSPMFPWLDSGNAFQKWLTVRVVAFLSVDPIVWRMWWGKGRGTSGWVGWIWGWRCKPILHLDEMVERVEVSG